MLEDSDHETGSCHGHGGWPGGNTILQKLFSGLTIRVPKFARVPHFGI